MKKIIYISIFVLLGISSVFAARVTNVELSYLDGNTVARIYVDGKIRFVHQTEEPKDGKPFRVIVDILAATHALGQKNFTALPDCLVESIRSSQYSVTPEEIVRVVFDLKESSIYRIEADNSAVTVYFQDKKTASFMTWSTVKYLMNPQQEKPKPAPVTVAQSLPSDGKKAEVKPVSQEPVVSKPVVAPNPVQAVLSGPTVQPETGIQKDVATSPPPPPVVKPVPAEKEKTTPPSKDIKLAVNDSPTVGPTVSQDVKPEQKLNTKPEAAETLAPEKPSPGSTSSDKPAPVKKEEKVEKKEAPQSEGKPQLEENKSQSTSTSRFRRSPTRPTKIKGTLVAEFPQRLVVKYKANAYRDPFETLINESRTYDSPIQQRLANVEGLKLVGVIESGAGNRALFEDNEGYSYILQSGDKVKKGYVLRVENDRVYFQIFEYGWSRTVALEIEEY
ncbi:MAG: hypothetical protein PHU88_06755 [candidate division Zixibacteria bacterium]|nr:hypothetical protein [candidate division Zixibacteria bacterium]